MNVPRDQAGDVPEPQHRTVTPLVGQTVYFYPDARERGMKSNDYARPFAAIVADVLNDRLVNLLVIDHNATTFASQSVVLFQGDDEDDKDARCHCELKPPAPPAPKEPAIPAPVAEPQNTADETYQSSGPYVPQAETIAPEAVGA